VTLRQLDFTVHGTPVPAGSKSAYRSGNRIVVVDTAHKRMKAWRPSIEAAAVDALDGGPLLEGPLGLTAVFVLARPKGHYGKRGLLPSARHYPNVKPDATKLVRGLEDVLTGIVWQDDSQIVSQYVAKRYTEGSARTYVRVWQLPPQGEDVGGLIYTDILASVGEGVPAAGRPSPTVSSSCA